MTGNALEFFLVVTRKRLRVVNLYDYCFFQCDDSDSVDTGGEPKKKKEKKKKKFGSKKGKTENSDLHSLDEEDNFAEKNFLKTASPPPHPHPPSRSGSGTANQSILLR